MLEILKNPNFDFLGKARYFVAFSLVVIVAGVLLMTRPDGIRFGVEFSGGTQVIAKFQNTPEVDRIRAAIPDAVIQNYDAPSKNQVLIRLAVAGENIDQAAPSVLRALSEKYGQNPVVESSAEVVGPVVGAELRKKAVQLTVLGLLFQLIYIAVRFKGAVWGAAATVAVFHDVLVTLAFLSPLPFEITLNVIAALLTLVGYSVNDTIVIFDRARENLRHKRKDPLRKIINGSGQPDAVPHPHLERHHLPGGAGPDVRRRGAARLRVHDGGRHRGGHLLHDLHREPVRDLVDGPDGQAPGVGGHGQGRDVI
jgi:preprotein translocase subunit SecF